jgi:hypothetical protein
MSPFVIRTAVPFGYAIAYVLLLGLLGLGIALLGTGIRRRRRIRAGVGALILALVIYVVAINVTAEGELNLNPQIDSAELAGKWAGSHDVALMLAVDGTYRCAGRGECALLTTMGSWQRRPGSDEVELRPLSSGSEVLVYSIVTYRGRLRLAHHIEDADAWDGEMPFELVSPAV